MKKMLFISKLNFGGLVIMILFYLFGFSTLYGSLAQAVSDKERITAELFAAAEKGDFEIVKNLVMKYPDLKDVKRSGGWTLLHLSNHSRELIEFLIEKGADIEARSDGQWTPLHSQVYGGHKDGVELLLDHGADMEAKHSYGITPLLNSTRWNRFEAAGLLIEKGANVDAADTLGRTSLIGSAIKGYPELVKILLAAGADTRVKDKNYERTALHFAALYGHLDVVAQLLKKGMNVDEKDAAGKTPLDYAIAYGHEKVAKLLISLGAESKIVPQHFGFSPFLAEAIKEGEAYAWYLGRIGYAVKTKNYFLIFSYWVSGNSPEEPRLANGHIDLDEIASLNTLVFAGSPVYWHHNPERYHQWQRQHKNIDFVYSFEDNLGRNPQYLKDVEGPRYIYLPSGEKKNVGNVKVECIPVSRGSGFLIEADGLVIFFGGDHLLMYESQRESFKKTIDDVKAKGKTIDLLILSSSFSHGRIFPSNLEGVDYAVNILKPKAFLASSGSESSDFLLTEVNASLAKYKNQIKIFCPQHPGDMFILKY